MQTTLEVGEKSFNPASDLFANSPSQLGCPIHDDSFIVGMGGNEDARAATRKERLSP
jgi:hypothetical protein